MNVSEIIKAVKDHGADLYFDGKKLKGRNTENLPDGLRQAIKDHVKEIVETMISPQKPYLKTNGELIIPLDCHPKYRWWMGGQSIHETLRELGASAEVITKYIDSKYSKKTRVH